MDLKNMISFTPSNWSWAAGWREWRDIRRRVDWTQMGISERSGSLCLSLEGERGGPRYRL